MKQKLLRQPLKENYLRRSTSLKTWIERISSFQKTKSANVEKAQNGTKSLKLVITPLLVNENPKILNKLLGIENILTA